MRVTDENTEAGSRMLRETLDRRARLQQGAADGRKWLEDWRQKLSRMREAVKEIPPCERATVREALRIAENFRSLAEKLYNAGLDATGLDL